MFSLIDINLFISEAHQGGGVRVHLFASLFVIKSPIFCIKRPVPFCYIYPMPFQRIYDFSGRINPRRPQAVGDLFCQKNRKSSEMA